MADRYNIDKFRKKRGMTNAELANKAKISHDMLYKIKAGRNIPSITIWSRLAEALNVSMDNLYAKKDYPVKPSLVCFEK